MKDKTQKDFKTKEEYLAYLNGYNDGVLWASGVHEASYKGYLSVIKDRVK